MALVRPFHALRPTPEVAPAVASVPYDVVSRAEALALTVDNPLSFLHVSRSEVDLDPEVDAYDDAVYQRAVANLARLKRDAPLVVEDTASLYVYRLREGAHEQTGVAGCFSLDEYDRDVVKKHERTRPDKEDDRTRHMLSLRAQTGIVFLTYRSTTAVDTVTTRACLRPPLFDVDAPDGVSHTIWRLEADDTAAIVESFKRVPSLYIADGHHRIASAARARDDWAAAGGRDESAEVCFFLGVAFPDEQTRILPYNRTVADLAGQTPGHFLDALRARSPVRADASPHPPPGHAAMYLDGRWYGIALTPGLLDARSVSGRLDVAVLQDGILAEILGVGDVRTDPRMAFVGGVRGIAELETRVDSGVAAVAFSLAAVTPQQLLAVSDADEIMPPKSTWFEPKLRDGLLIHEI